MLCRFGLRGLRGGCRYRGCLYRFEEVGDIVIVVDVRWGLFREGRFVFIGERFCVYGGFGSLYRS